MDPKQELVKSWLEKAIKGWLVQNDQRFEKIHDLRLLVSTAEEIEPRFKELYESAERLTPYATVYRYPGEVFLPDFEEFNQALQDAENILNFVLLELEHKSSN
jgi:HEPN domain-containing protein